LVLPGSKVKCPKCKNVFHVHASDDDGMVETIPVLGDEAAAELEVPLSDDPDAPTIIRPTAGNVVRLT
jgi:hypothetical protein